MMADLFKRFLKKETIPEELKMGFLFLYTIMEIEEVWELPGHNTDLYGRIIKDKIENEYRFGNQFYSIISDF